MNKKKLTIDKQYEYMYNQMGIKFDLVNESEAKHYLCEHNYFFKLKAYSKNFSKFSEGPNKGKYINLDFKHLIELATLDLRLRQIIIRMCLNLEHSLRTYIVFLSTNNEFDDGFMVVKKFLSNNDRTKNEINKASNSNITSPLYSKYNSDFSVWSLVELLTFSGITRFFNYYYSYFQRRGYNIKKLNNYFEFNVRHLRNAAAHNNCLINDLREYDRRGIDKFSVDEKVKKYIHDNIKLISNKEKNKYLKVPVIQDFVSLLLMYDEFVKSEGVKKNDYEELNSLFKDRMLRNKNLFEHEPILVGSYKFVVKIIDFICIK